MIVLFVLEIHIVTHTSGGFCPQISAASLDGGKLVYFVSENKCLRNARRGDSSKEAFVATWYESWPCISVFDTNVEWMIPGLATKDG